MKKIALSIFSLGCILSLASCNSQTKENSEKESSSVEIESSKEETETSTKDETSESSNKEESPESSKEEPSVKPSEPTETSTLPEESSSIDIPTPLKNYTIYLAGDSTVKTYEDNQYIGGWGQYLDLFTNDNVTVVNCAQGGRSSRSFINEGRLYNITGNNYSFTQNNGKSIEDTIKAGDYLFIQFGHNDDDTKMASSASSNYSTVYDRMVPLGTPDSNGVYPTTAGEKVSTTHLPELYTTYATEANKTSALKEIAKYGDTYYAYDSNGTYKWYLKQYIDFARERGVTPVLVTPVARVKFSGDEIVGGPGLHGDNFAYVEAVRQLAEEEDCLLVDLFKETKTLLETATPTYANYLMALKPNDLTGLWPSGYDTTYNNSSLGYQGIEATHYNKYGAYLTAGKMAEAIITDKTKHNGGKEYFEFQSSMTTSPKTYINPSNLIAKSKINALENLFKVVNVTDPNRTYPDPQVVIDKINEMAKTTVSQDTYVALREVADLCLAAYNNLNVDDRTSVTNYSTLTKYISDIEALELANRPVATKTVLLDPSTLTATTYSSTFTSGDFKIACTSDKTISVMSNKNSFVINGEEVSVTNLISMGGSASFGNYRYIEFSTTGKCKITVVCKSTGSDERLVNMVKSGSTTVVGSFTAGTSLTVTQVDITEAGTYQLGSSNKGVYIAYILIEYFE